MGKKYQAVFKCHITVEFEEDDRDEALVLEDQAHEELMFKVGHYIDDSDLVEINEIPFIL